MKHVILGILAATPLFAAQARQTFTGVITDEICGESHASMRMGPTDAECTVACVNAHGARYALVDGKNVYILSDEKTPERFAGQKVRVVGTLDAKTKTIQVESMSQAK
jgi:hypothetical protein